MPNRTPEPWESGAAAPFLWIETAQGNVEVWALGEDRFRITAPGHEQLVTGFDEAERTAGALAARFGVGGGKARGPTPSYIGPPVGSSARGGEAPRAKPVFGGYPLTSK
jgi:hypothetical protein